MIAELMLVAGAAALALALRSYRHPTLFRLGTLCAIGASFLAGWRLGGSLALGFLCASIWLLLPWLEILTRLRALRIPAERVLTSRPPPSRSAFPDLLPLSDEIEAEGFEQLADVGWEDESSRQFYRIFRGPGGRVHAAICMAEHPDLAFYYLTLTSRLPSGRVFLTWNYPFCYGLKFSPTVSLNRVEGMRPFAEFLALHRQFLLSRGIAEQAPEELDGGALLEAMRRDFRTQIRHNIEIGLLRQEDPSTIRYTFRGLCFLWFQFLRDLVRIFP